MTRKLSGWLCLLAGLLLTPLIPAADKASSEARRPDIVLFISDDLSVLDVTAYGAQGFRTPTMQLLADRGVAFDQAFVASPSCAPSRAALLTGLMPSRNRAEANHSKPLPEIKKWPAYFQELGYEVVAYGKVSHYKHTGDYGFDSFAHDSYHEDIAIPRCAEFLRKRGKGDKPLCLLVGTNWPHVPWPEKHPAFNPDDLPIAAGNVDTPETREFRARYAAAINRADRDLKTTLDAVEEVLGKETLIAFTSDHGAQWPFGKWNCYDAGVRVPLIVSWPGVIAPGTRTPAMVSWVDLLPTLVEAAGGTPAADLDGRSFLSVLKGEKSAHRDEIFTTHSGDGNWNIYPIRSVRTDRWKYIRNLHPEFAFTTHVDLPNREGQRTYFPSWEKQAETDPAAAAIIRKFHQRPAEELYDLQADPTEQANLAEKPEHQEVLAKLRGSLDEWMKAQGDQQTVFNEPRLLSDPTSYGPNSYGGDPQSVRKRKEEKAAP